MLQNVLSDKYSDNNAYDDKLNEILGLHVKDSALLRYFVFPARRYFLFYFVHLTPLLVHGLFLFFTLLSVVTMAQRHPSAVIYCYS